MVTQNFAAKAFQSGTVVMLGKDQITWRSAKQPRVANNTTGSEAIVIVATYTLAEFVRAMTESVGPLLFEVKFRCHNRPNIVLKLEERTWKSKGFS